MDEATAKAAKALIEQLLIVAAGLQALIEPIVTEEEPDQAPIDDVQAAVDAIVTTAEEEKNLSRQTTGNKAVLASVAQLQKQFTALLNTPQGRQLPRSTGPADTKKRVL
jgi:hypothetical protein